MPHTSNYLAYTCVFVILIALLDGLQNANRGSRSCLLSEMFDAKAWLQPHMEQLHNHTNPHIFRFVKGRDGHCYMQWKHWNHNQWEPMEGLGISLLKVNVIRCRKDPNILYPCMKCGDDDSGLYIVPDALLHTQILMMNQHWSLPTLTSWNYRH